MKGSLAVAAVAALAGSVEAHAHRGHNHLFAHKRGGDYGEVCVPGCTTSYTTITGPGTWVPAPPPKTTETPAPPPPPPATTTEVVPVVPMPTPEPETCPTPGTYTFSATTVTVSETTTVCAATTTSVPSGTHTVGGVTTVVETSTTVVCPYATVTTSGTVTTSTILTTTTVCPSAGTYTIAPHTTEVTTDTVIVYPTPTEICPGTYTRPVEVVTVTETDYVHWCPYSSVGVPTSEYSKPTEAPQAPAPKPKPSTPKPKPSPKPHNGGGNGGNLGGQGDHWGVAYTPYDQNSGNCKSASQVDSDIAAISQAGFEVCRVYSTDCNTLENVGNACEKHGVKMIVGVFIDSTGCSYNNPAVKEQVDDLANWGKWDLVDLFSVGNEAVMNGYCTAQELRQLITTVKSKCSGYTGPYTVSETLNVWQGEGFAEAICDVIDITAANIHAYFNQDVEASQAGKFVEGQLALLEKVCNQECVVLESGWPAAGKTNGKAVPGKSQQAQAIKSIREAVGSKTCFFTLFDDAWKAEGDCGCERSWGMGSCFEIDINIGI